MSAVAVNLIGRFGNQLFQYAFARAFCEKQGCELRTNEWIGERLFTLDGLNPKRPDGSEETILSGYAQRQEDLIYTRADARRWFVLKPEVQRVLYHKGLPLDISAILSHRRVGDYISCGYPVISEKSYIDAIWTAGFDDVPLARFVTEERPLRLGPFDGIGASFFPDFMRLVNAPILFRGNSSFSWWAAVLAEDHQKVYSPVIDFLEGGREHDGVRFVRGNYPKLSNLPVCTDLHLSP